jgi:hypothetical protein
VESFNWVFGADLTSLPSNAETDSTGDFKSENDDDDHHYHHHQDYTIVNASIVFDMNLAAAELRLRWKTSPQGGDSDKHLWPLFALYIRDSFSCWDVGAHSFVREEDGETVAESTEDRSLGRTSLTASIYAV